MILEMNAEKWKSTNAYLDEVFGAQDSQLETLMRRAVDAGIPDIAVSPSVGRMLMVLAQLVCEPGRPRPGSPERAPTIVEVGTLAGYSGIWLARGLGGAGRLITIEPEPKHADFAQREFDAAGLGDRVEIRRGFGLEVLPALAGELGDGSVDLVYFDAIKIEYAGYFEHARTLLRPGGLLVADNALGSSDWWITEGPGSNPSRDAQDAFNRQLAADPAFEACCVPIRQGVLIARKI